MEFLFSNLIDVRVYLLSGDVLDVEILPIKRGGHVGDQMPISDGWFSKEGEGTTHISGVKFHPDQDGIRGDFYYEGKKLDAYWY